MYTSREISLVLSLIQSVFTVFVKLLFNMNTMPEKSLLKESIKVVLDREQTKYMETSENIIECFFSEEDGTYHIVVKDSSVELKKFFHIYPVIVYELESVNDGAYRSIKVKKFIKKIEPSSPSVFMLILAKLF